MSARLRTCQAPGCGRSIDHLRPQATTCDAACRKALYQHRKRSARDDRTVSLAGQAGYFEALGAHRGYFDDWRPNRKAKVMLGQVQCVLDEYCAQLPLTCRQVYYRMVGEFRHPKGTSFERSLYRLLYAARRAQIIPFEHIRDDGIAEYGARWRRDVCEVTDDWQRWAQGFTRDKQEGQEVRLEVWCESAGMVPQLGRVASRYSVPVFSCGGFNSLTAVRQIVDSCVESEVPTRVLHLGDCDPSGYSIFQAMFEDVAEFVEADGGVGFQAERVAATFEQIEEFGLVADEIKTDDSRSRSWKARGHTHKVELEAFAPSNIAELLTEAIERHLHMDLVEDLRTAERADRVALTRCAVGAALRLRRDCHEDRLLELAQDDETVLVEGW